MFLTVNTNVALVVRLELVCEKAKLDEQWSFVGNKSNQRWLWHAVDHATNTVLAYVFGQRKDVVFKNLKALLATFNRLHKLHTGGCFVIKALIIYTQSRMSI